MTLNPLSLFRGLIAAGFLISTAVVRSGTGPTPLYQRADAPVEVRIKDLLRRMTLEEKARQLDMYQGAALVDKTVDNTHSAPDAKLNVAAIEKALGSLGAGSIHDVYPSATLYNEIQAWVISHNRLGIPALFLEEGVHGYSAYGQTIFPHSIALASTWDTSLAQQTGAAIASEARANGVGMLLCPVLDVAREPRWGRIEEDFGEDPYLTGLLGAAYVKGAQGTSLATDHTVVAEPKHFAGHGSPEGGLNTSPVHAGEREVRSVFLRSFEPAVRDAGAMGVMAAYHEIDGIPCAGNPWLLTTVLREEWGFKGLVLSDLGAINELYSRHHVAATPADAVRMAITSGVDMQFYDFSHSVFQNALVDGVKSHKMSEAVLDQAVSRVLRVKFELGLFDHPMVDPHLAPTVTRAPEHLELALQSARESICLLKNVCLPLNKAGNLRIALIGPNASEIRMGDYTVTPASAPENLGQAIRRLVPNAVVTVVDGANLEAAANLAKESDFVVAMVGEGNGDSGEGSDRSDLNLPGNQSAMVAALTEAKTPVVLLLENGRPLSLRGPELEKTSAIIEAWYPGERGAQAIAETLFGDNNPSGKLPISFPRSVGVIPDYYNHDPSKSTNYVDGSSQPIFPFGFGLSYTTFRYGQVTTKVGSGIRNPLVSVTFDLTNSGDRAGDEVVQLYLRKDTASVALPVRSLKAFARVHLERHETKSVTFKLGRRELEIWGAQQKWAVEPGSYTIYVGGSSEGGKVAHFSL